MSDIEDDEPYDDEYDQDNEEADDFTEPASERHEDSYRQQERATHGADEGWKDLTNREYIGDHPLYQTPEQIFRANIMQILISSDLMALRKMMKFMVLETL